MTHGFSPGMTPLAFIDLIFTQISWGFPCGSDCKESACNAGHLGSIPGLGRSPEGGNGNPFQYSCLKNPKDRGAWEATVHWITKSRTHWATNTFTFIFTHTAYYIYTDPEGRWGVSFPQEWFMDGVSHLDSEQAELSAQHLRCALHSHLPLSCSAEPQPLQSDESLFPS